MYLATCAETREPDGDTLLAKQTCALRAIDGACRHESALRCSLRYHTFGITCVEGDVSGHTGSNVKSGSEARDDEKL